MVKAQLASLVVVIVTNAHRTGPSCVMTIIRELPLARSTFSLQRRNYSYQRGNEVQSLNIFLPCYFQCSQDRIAGKKNECELALCLIKVSTSVLNVRLTLLDKGSRYH